jgi:hypothetical protein
MTTLSLFGTVFNKVRATVKVTSSVLLPLRSKNKLQFTNLRGDQKTISACKPYGRLTCLVPRGGLPFDQPEISHIVLYHIFGDILHQPLPCRGGKTFLSVNQSGSYDCTIVALFSYIISVDAYLISPETEFRLEIRDEFLDCRIYHNSDFTKSIRSETMAVVAKNQDDLSPNQNQRRR